MARQRIIAVVAVLAALAAGCGGSTTPRWSAAARSWGGVEYTYAANVHVVRVDTRDAADTLRPGAIVTVQCGQARGQIVAGGVSSVALGGDAPGPAPVCDIFEPGREQCGMQASDPGYARLEAHDPPASHARLLATAPSRPTRITVCTVESKPAAAQPHVDIEMHGGIVGLEDGANVPAGDLDLAVRAPAGAHVCWEFGTAANRSWYPIPPAKVVHDGESIDAWPVDASGGVLHLRWNAWELTPGIDDYPREVRLAAVAVEGDQAGCGGAARTLGAVTVEYAP